MHEVGVEVVGLGTLGYLKELMQLRNMTVESLYAVRTIKEKLCYVAADYNAELRKNTHASCEVSGEGLFTLSKECSQAVEILFQPQIGGVSDPCIWKTSYQLCSLADLGGSGRPLKIFAPPIATVPPRHRHVTTVHSAHDGWFKTVVLAGGTACLRGLPEVRERDAETIALISI